MARCFIFLILLFPACAPTTEVDSPMEPDGTFGADVAFLREYTDAIVLSKGDAAIAVTPGMQGRVMTSTASGDSGSSFGWINYDLIRSGEKQPHINAYGGEERFWLGPEGGQFSIYFEPDDPFDLEHWQVPAAIDTEPFDLVSQEASAARFHREMHLMNYAETHLNIAVDREVRLLDRDEVASLIGIGPDPQLSFVAYQSRNEITNIGDEPWTIDSGTVSIWILGMYNPSPATTVVIPFVEGPVESLGPVVNDAYFGEVPEDRLVIRPGVLFFKGDGKYRSKIGLSRERATPVLGSYDAEGGVLTIVHYNKPTERRLYVNSMWEIQETPFSGDVVNSYNDGPPEPGAPPLGPFYELESSSPAALLDPEESLVHQHTTMHFTGAEQHLNELAGAVLGVGLADIVDALP